VKSVAIETLRRSPEQQILKKETRMPEQKLMPKPVRRHLESRMLGAKIQHLTVENVLGCGNTAVTYEARDDSGVRWALKLVTRESYGDRAPFREVARFSEAEDERFLVFPKEIGDWTLRVGSKDHEFVFFKSRCVRGVTLEEFITSHTNFCTKTEILRYAENVAAALNELNRLGFSHGDLHNRNIMREVIGEHGISPEVRYVIIDFSEAHPTEDTQDSLSKDIERFGEHLRCFYDVVSQRESLTREEERILQAIAHIPGLLNGTAPESMAISTPKQILERLNHALSTVAQPPRTLHDPFHPLSTENIASDALLADLCFTEMPWTTDLEKISNVLLIGPRGCGKTMIFRRLRLKTKIAAKKFKEIQEDPYVAFYIPCESVFYMRFSDLSEVDVDKNKEALVLYFNMAILAEVCSALCTMPVAVASIPQAATVALVRFAKDELSPLWQTLRLPAALTNLDELANCSRAVMRHIRKAVGSGEAIHAYGATDFVARLVEIVKSKVPALSQKYLLFFLDDYTHGRVPIALQEALHPTVCQRSSDVGFKLAAHMFGSIYDSPRPLTLDEGRNIMVINLGSAYLNRNKRKREGKLLLKILDARFKHSSSYEGPIERWLGKTAYPGNKTLSRTLRDQNHKTYYHGTKCLMDLCTGDYSEMIRMVGEIFREANVGPGSSVRKIPASVQHRAIYKVSREYLSRVRHIRPDGQKLFEIVDNFGKLSRKLLVEREQVTQGLTSQGKPREEPYDLLTVYVDDITKTPPMAQSVWQRLQKASVFVEVGLATSQRSVVADRATLRRIYCPAFRTTLTSSEHLQLSKDAFEYFIDKPDEFCRNYLRNVTKSKAATVSQMNGMPRERADEEPCVPFFPSEGDKTDFVRKAPQKWREITESLVPLAPLSQTIGDGASYDLFVGALGFEERTTAGAAALVKRGVKTNQAILLEFDRYYEANGKNRDTYENLMAELTCGRPYRPLNAPFGTPDPIYCERLTGLLNNLRPSECPRVLFDCTSCPSLILSQTLSVLLAYSCDLTIVYSEANEYFPTRDEWERENGKHYGNRVEGPFTGVRFVAKPPILQGDDTGEHPVLLVLFPTFNTERTDGVLGELDPAERIWLFGEPHNVARNSYRIEMEKSYAAPIMCPGDAWSLLTTFDYRTTLAALGGIYASYRPDFRIVIMPHGSKTQTLAVSLFRSIHDISLVFAMPREYDPDKYSKGCTHVWTIPFGDTRNLTRLLRSARPLTDQSGHR